MLAINDYLRGNSLGVDIDGMLVHDDDSNYLNYFGYGRQNREIKSDSQLVGETTRLYELLITVWNDNYTNGPHQYVEMCFANCFKVDSDDRDPNFTGSFNLLFSEYSLEGDPGTIKLFNCRRSESDRPMLYGKEGQPFLIQ